jgi:hypothetical protein
VAALKKLADRGLTAGCVLANLHHRRIIPQMERRLRIFEMIEDADPIALAESRLLRDPFPRSYAATRARRTINLRPGHGDDASLWAFDMLPAGQLVSGFLYFLSCLAGFLGRRHVLKLRLTPADGERERREVRPTHASVPRTAQRRERERVERRRERNARRRERREQRSEEFRLREQQGLSSPGTEEYSSSDEEEEEDEEEDRGAGSPR